MERAENETLICINDADRDEGFFRFGTSKRMDYERLVRRVGVVPCTLSKRADDPTTITWWECKVPIRFLNKTTWAIRTPKAAPKNAFMKKGA